MFVRGFFALVECLCCVITCNLWLSSLSKKSRLFLQSNVTNLSSSVSTVSPLFSILTVACQTILCAFLYLYCIVELIAMKYCCYPAPLILFYSMCTNKSRCKMGHNPVAHLCFLIGYFGSLWSERNLTI